MISIVTPSFNSEIYIEECIKSILEQNFDDFEHIIIDGGSEDNTISILKKYPHLKWISEKDKGQSDALNKGFKMASGEWVLWLNSDDLLLPGALNAYKNHIIKYTNVDFFYGHIDFIDANKTLLKSVNNIPYLYCFTIFGLFTPPSTGSLFRKKFIVRYPLDVNFHYTMDTEWFLRVGRGLKTKLVNKKIVAFRFWENNKTYSLHTLTELPEQHKKERGKYYDTYINPYLYKNGNSRVFMNVYYKMLYYFFKLFYKLNKAD